MEESILKNFVSDPTAMREYQAERLILEVTERVCQLMDEKGINRAELAETMGVTRARVSQLLNGSANITLRKLSDIFVALNRTVHINDISINEDLERKIVPVIIKNIYSAKNKTHFKAEWSLHSGRKSRFNLTPNTSNAG